MSTTTSYLIFLNSSLSTPAQIQEIAGLAAPPVARLAEKVTKEYIPDDDELEDIETEVEEADTDTDADADTTTTQQVEAGPSPPKTTNAETPAPPPQTCCLISPSTLSALTTWSTTHALPLGLIISLARTASASTSASTSTYPVTYFLYGTLADGDFLAGKLELRDEEREGLVLKGTKVRGWRVMAWGQYLALVRAGEGEVVEGVGYEVRSEEELGRLAGWMGDRYEVVRVEVECEDGKTVEGCCFAFCGEENQLEEVG